MKKPIIAISIPTGIGADIGGYAGDFGYLAREFSRDFHLIVNPNALNGGIFSAINKDMEYLEGYLFDEFFKGNIGILPLEEYKQNKIGVIFDCEIPQNILNVHINTINALKMVQGIDVCEIEYTKEAVGVEIKIENGISFGNLKNPKTLLDCARNLISKGVEAIAVVCYFGQDCEDENYSNGSGIDPIGGVEAIISHLITKTFKIPCAHAPAFCAVDISNELENPKVSSETVSSTYLPCVLQGLSVAPKIVEFDFKNAINYKKVDYLIVPYDAMGSPAVLSSYQNGVNVVAVKNKTVLDVTPLKINLEKIRVFENYRDCLWQIKANKIAP